MKASYLLINEKGSWTVQPSQKSWKSELLCWGFQLKGVAHNCSLLHKVSREDFPGTDKENKEYLVLLNLQTKINIVHEVVWLLINLPPQPEPRARPNAAAGISTCFTVSRTFMTALAAKGEISDCFHISTVICVAYFSTFKHEIHKKNMNQKMHGSMFKKICVHDCVLSVLGHLPADDGVRLWYQTRHTSGSRAASCCRLPSDLRQQPGRGSSQQPSATTRDLCWPRPTRGLSNPWGCAVFSNRCISRHIFTSLGDADVQRLSNDTHM